MQETLRWQGVSDLAMHRGAIMKALVQHPQERLQHTRYSDMLKSLEESAKLLKLQELQKVEVMQHSGQELCNLCFCHCEPKKGRKNLFRHGIRVKKTKVLGNGLSIKIQKHMWLLDQESNRFFFLNFYFVCIMNINSNIFVPLYWDQYDESMLDEAYNSHHHTCSAPPMLLLLPLQ